jgi:hypothetical protein
LAEELNDLVYGHLFFKSLPSISVDIFFISVCTYTSYPPVSTILWSANFYVRDLLLFFSSTFFTFINTIIVNTVAVTSSQVKCT